MTEELHVATAIEGSYSPHAAAMLHSVLAQSDGLAVHVHCLHGPDLSERSADLLSQMLRDGGARVDFLAFGDERVRGLPTKGFTGKATWYRVFLPDLLPEVERLLYLDADLIALDSLEPLWQTELGSSYVAAVTNVFMSHHAHRSELLGLPEAQRYFNAGVMLMNLDLMRREHKTRDLMAYALDPASELGWRDQDALNVVLGERRLRLHPRWNCMNAVMGIPESEAVFDPTELAEARQAPAIRHFEGPGANKPWHYLCTADRRELYFEHRRATPWPKVRLEGRNPRNVIRRMAGAARSSR